MGMICNLLRVPEAELESYLADSSLLESTVYSDEPEEETGVENEKLIDIDKAWDGILFLLTGSGFANAAHPLARIFFSGQIIDEEQDLGYGPAHYLTPAQVSELNDEISNITVDSLRQKYNPKRMTELEVYPAMWENDGDEEFEYLSQYFTNVQEFYAEAAKNGEAVVTFLN